MDDIGARGGWSRDGRLHTWCTCLGGDGDLEWGVLLVEDFVCCFEVLLVGLSGGGSDVK